MVTAAFAGCKSNDEEVWESYYETVSGSGKGDKTTSSGKSESSTKNNSSKIGSKGDAGVAEPSNTHKGGDLVIEGAGQDKNADYSVKGTVTVAIDTARVCDYQALFDSFKKVYPNVKLKFDYYAHSGTDAAIEYLTTRAATNTLPDIVFNEAGFLHTYLVNGWLHPLDEFVKNDSDYKNYVPDNLKKDL